MIWLSSGFTQSLSRTRYFFSLLSYSDYKHLQEQMMFEVTGIRPGWSGDPVFAIGLNFMERNWSGRFNGSLIVIMGSEDFIMVARLKAERSGGHHALPLNGSSSKGLVVMLGDGLVDLEHTDKGIRLLLEYMFRRDKDLGEAIEAVMKDIRPDAHGSKLRYIIPIG